MALWDRCGLLRPWNDPRKDIARKLRVQAVGLVEGELVASVMAGYEGHRGWINYLAVDPAASRRAGGRAMMSAAERRLGELGCPKVSLQLRRENREVVAFYSQLGFVEDDVVSFGKRLEHDGGSES